MLPLSTSIDLWVNKLMQLFMIIFTLGAFYPKHYEDSRIIF